LPTKPLPILAAFLCAFGGFTQAAERPNIVLLMGDEFVRMLSVDAVRRERCVREVVEIVSHDHISTGPGWRRPTRGGHQDRAS